MQIFDITGLIGFISILTYAVIITYNIEILLLGGLTILVWMWTLYPIERGKCKSILSTYHSLKIEIILFVPLMFLLMGVACILLMPHLWMSIIGVMACIRPAYGLIIQLHAYNRGMRLQEL